MLSPLVAGTASHRPLVIVSVIVSVVVVDIDILVVIVVAIVAVDVVAMVVIVVKAATVVADTPPPLSMQSTSVSPWRRWRNPRHRRLSHVTNHSAEL